ncbi:MutS-related protein [Massilia endophytica]|uniref:MutS-related protein n=1 Tax=Massilia endophytica TaxID=2899220 RepID=UPI001E439B11|nr:DNA mismatch repair protein MutS [Massilia endophytica]UGQ46701.1 DNA mismatch repair protein MutS [Massilia endophytica]
MDYPFARSDIARYDALTGAPVIDEQTWKDMLLDSYLALLSRGVSIFGQQMLYHRLRSGAADAGGLRTRLADSAGRADMERACRPLREADAEVSGTLFGEALAAAPRWAAWLPALPVLLAASIACGLQWGLWWIAALGVCALMLALQAVWHDRIGQWRRELLSLRLMLNACHALWPGDRAAARLSRQLAPPVLEQMPLLREYSDWLLLRNVSHYFASRKVVAGQLPFLRSCYVKLAAVEADLALARHLDGAARFCWSGRADGRELELRGLVHPLLPDPAPLDLALRDKGVFISGQNGVGKSTFLRAVGLNAIAARAFGFCYAEAARLPDMPVHSSMQSEDALDEGESLYIAELRRARELLAIAEAGPSLFIVDEIFLGTNHLESVSAATAVMEALAARGTVLVSSHNLVLASLLKEWLTPVCVAQTEDGLRLQPGILGETNGLALLAQKGFSVEIQNKAARVYSELLGAI